MADDEEKKKHTLETLFVVYANYNTNPLELENETYESILLTQIDYWLDQAKLLKTVFSMTETGLAYMKFKKWRLDYEEFLEFLQQICVDKEIKFDNLKELLLAAGVPGGTVVVVK